MRIISIVVLACLVVVAALSQQRIERLQTAPVQQPQMERPQVDEVTTLRRDVTRLRTDLDNLRRQMDQLSNEFRASVPHCEGSASVSSKGRRDCGPFSCDQATGQCVSSCNSSNDCAAGNSCDMRCGRCGKTPQCG